MTNALVDQLFCGVEWIALPEPAQSPKPSDIPYATHVGNLKIGTSVLTCYQLNTGERVISVESFERFLGVLNSANENPSAPERTPEAKA